MGSGKRGKTKNKKLAKLQRTLTKCQRELQALVKSIEPTPQYTTIGPNEYVFGDHVMVELFDRDVIDGPVGKFEGYIVYNVGACNACAVFLNEKKRHVFVPKNQITRLKAKDAASLECTTEGLSRGTILLKMPRSLGYEEVRLLVEFPTTDEFLVQFPHRPSGSWWSGYTIAKRDQLRKFPARLVEIDTASLATVFIRGGPGCWAKAQVCKPSKCTNSVWVQSVSFNNDEQLFPVHVKDLYQKPLKLKK